MPSPRAYASRWASPISRIAPPARSSSEAASDKPGLLASMALREAPSASDEAPVCSAMNRPFREPLHGNAERVRLRGDLGLPLGDPDERGGRVGKGPAGERSRTPRPSPRRT